MGCTFCATGSMGLKGNLTTGEILEQLVHANAVMPIRNIVFMVRAMSHVPCQCCHARSQYHVHGPHHLYMPLCLALAGFAAGA